MSHGNAPIGMANVPPAEILEAAYPVYFTNWGLRQDSGGPGRQRGGLGCVYEVELLEEDASLVVFGERARFPAFGVLGGGSGAPNRVFYDQSDGRHESSMGAKVIGKRLARGQHVRIESPGGGGYGDVSERPVADVERDLRLGLVSPEAARSAYGVEIDPAGRAHKVAP